jgi:hypothetical protein
MSGKLSPSAGTIWWPTSQRTTRPSISRVTIIRTILLASVLGWIIFRLLVTETCPITSCPLPLACPVTTRAVTVLPPSQVIGPSSHRRLAIVFPFIASHVCHCIRLTHPSIITLS